MERENCRLNYYLKAIQEKVKPWTPLDQYSSREVLAIQEIDEFHIFLLYFPIVCQSTCT